MERQHERAELQDRVHSLLALGALPFSAILVLDAFSAGTGNAGVVNALSWVAKGLLGLVVVVLTIYIVRKWRAGGARAPETESFSTTILFKAATLSWGATFMLLVQFYDRLFRGNGILGIAGLPLEHSGEIVAAFMLLVFSISYFGMNLSLQWASGEKVADE
ncbi:MAG: hypothetical protein GF341_09715 [candidate division Zixibacteria bacterium]|nr:hypothetical protein [candidate division Zixibacteria bacterium]